ncbi:MAG: hypothetical protein ACKOWJ_04025 [Micrococcales bacterium]
MGPHRVGGLTPAQQRLVSLLIRGIPTNSLTTVANELAVENPGDLVAKLGPALLSDEPAVALDRDYVEHHFAELCRVQASYSVEGSRVIAARRNASVFIDDCDTAALLATALKASGVATILTKSTSDAQLANVDVAITIDQSAISPVNHRRFLSLGVPQIAIQFDSTGVFISPLIEVGKTPCLTCLQIAGGEAQIAIDTQLLFSAQRFDDSVSEHFAVAIAAQTALRRIDQQAGFEIADFHRVGYRLNSSTGAIAEFRWHFAENCLCHQGLDGRV